MGDGPTPGEDDERVHAEQFLVNWLCQDGEFGRWKNTSKNDRIRYGEHIREEMIKAGYEHAADRTGKGVNSKVSHEINHLPYETWAASSPQLSFPSPPISSPILSSD